MSALLAAAVFGPAAVVVLARLAPTAPGARRWTAHGHLALAGLWLALAVLGRDAELGRFGAGLAPAAVGTWLLAASASWPARRATAALATVAAALAAGSLAVLGGTGDLADLAGGLAMAAAVVVIAARTEGDGGLVSAAACVLGAAAAALGVARDAELLTGVGATVVAVAAAWRVRRAAVPLLPAAIVLAALTVPDRWPWLLAAAVAATILAHRPAVALALWAVVAVAFGVDAGLAGGAAVLVAVTLHPALAVVALPAVAALAPALAGRSSRWSAVVLVLATITALRLWRRPDDVMPGPPTLPTAAALGAGAWLLLAPETWVADPGLESWGTGVIVAAVAAAVTAFVVASFSEAPVPVPDVEVADPLTPAADPRWAWPASLASVGILAACGVALVASIVS